jgi:MFS superfamily sulfate permease-like transporter
MVQKCRAVYKYHRDGGDHAPVHPPEFRRHRGGDRAGMTKSTWHCAHTLSKPSCISTIAPCEQDVDFDQELFSVGLGNVLCGAAGGFVGYCSVAKTMLCHSMGGHQKAGVFAVAYYVGYWFVLFAFARFIPLPVLGAFICAIGLELVLEWTLHMKHKVCPD